MGKVTFSNLPVISTDQGFKDGYKPLADALVACGLTKTADTGQIDWTATFTPTISTVAGYEVYRFNDALQATSPVFFKIEYAWGSATNRPSIFVTVGTGSNGAGTITGIVSNRTDYARATNPNAVVAVPSYVCYKPDGFFGMAFAWGLTVTGTLFFAIERARDDTGAAVVDGLYILASSSSNSALMAAHIFNGGGGPQTAPSAAAGVVGCLVPQSSAASVVGSDVQVFRHYVATPRIRNVVGVLTYINSEFGSGIASAFTVAAVGQTQRTYLPLGSQMLYCDAGGGSGKALAMLWEA